MTNLVDESWEFQGSWFGDEQLIGVDDLGRGFEVQKVLGCGKVSPGGYEDCIAVFDVAGDVSITALEFYVMDKRVISLPAVTVAEEDSDEDEEE